MGMPAEIPFHGQQAMQALGAFIEACEGAVYVDADGIIRWMNERYAAFLGIYPESAVGRPVGEVISNTRLPEVLHTGEPILLDVQIIRDQPILVTRLPLRDENNVIVGAMGVMLYDRLQRLQPMFSQVQKLQARSNDLHRESEQKRCSRYTLSSITGNGAAIADVKRQLSRCAPYNSTVLLLGETGTGKELAAHAIHSASPRAAGPFVAVNIAAIPDTLIEAELFGVAAGAYTGADRRGRHGKFTIADGGTLFLDEIGDMPVHVQVKLLRVLQEREVEPLGSNVVTRVNVRVVVATRRDLREMVSKHLFRADLYYRLSTIPIRLPALRDRPEDLGDICESLLRTIALETGLPHMTLSRTALDLLRRRDWPGNIRELRNVLERACIASDSSVLDTSAFDDADDGTHDSPSPSVSLSGSRPLVSTASIAQALRITYGNKSAAARLLGVPRSTFYARLREIALEDNRADNFRTELSDTQRTSV
jgi:transcriptional regulator with PAS, ATPase and Fis domain